MTLGLAACGEAGGPGAGSDAAGDTAVHSDTGTRSDDDGPSGVAQSAPSAGGASSGVGDIDVSTFSTEAKQSPQFPSSVDPAGEGEELLLHTVRVGRHDGFDRVVFEHSGDGMPAWRVQYVRKPTQPGSGGAVDMPGKAFIAVHAQGLKPGNAGERAGHRVGERDWTRASSIVRSTYSTVVFEGSSTYYIALDRQRPFEIRALEDAPRLVVDIKR